MEPNTPFPVTVGRLVLYKISEADAEAINRRRMLQEGQEWTVGAQRHTGNNAQAGDLMPTLVVKVWEGNKINGQVFLDGNDTLWVTSVQQGPEAGQWDWMPFQKDQQARLPKEDEETEPTEETEAA